ncbi:MAG: aminoacyl-tRNA hydrolase [Porticoccus sp.]|nr:aminoacyl-tRNA hydrolase [Porticoccus sp.]
MDTPVQLIVGLGNPGQQYEQTRHNAGADFVLALSKDCNITLKPEGKFFGATGKIILGNQAVRLLLPETFMNLSGKAIAAMAGFYQIPPEAILVVHDELDLSPGTSRFKLGGGHGGHNGLKDTIRALGNSRNFARLRIGIGHPGHSSEVVDFVLRKAPQSEQQLINNSIDDAVCVMPLAVTGQWNSAMKELHSPQ